MKAKIALAAAAAVLLLAGCQKVPPSEQEIAAERNFNATELGEGAENDFGILTDPRTGCQYIVWDGFRTGGITPRLAPGGRQVCAEAVLGLPAR